MAEKRVSIAELGRRFKETKSEKTFKQLFEICKPTAINYFKQFNNPEEILEDAFNETMISIWNDIDKLDVENYSISTMIFLRMKQNLIRQYKKTGGQNNSLDIDESSVISLVNSEDNDLTYDIEDDYIENENIDSFWSNVKTILNNDISYNIMYDKYVNNLKSKDIAKKYDTKLQNVLNRIFNAKKKLESNQTELYNEFIK